MNANKGGCDKIKSFGGRFSLSDSLLVRELGMFFFLRLSQLSSMLCFVTVLFFHGTIIGTRRKYRSDYV